MYGCEGFFETRRQSRNVFQGDSDDYPSRTNDTFVISRGFTETGKASTLSRSV